MPAHPFPPPLAPRQIPPQFAAPPRRVRLQTAVALMYAAMQQCITARQAGLSVASAHTHTGRAVVTTRPQRITPEA